MWVKFSEPFQYRPSAMISIHYKAGKTYNVPTPCAQAAVAAGKAEKMRKPTRAAAVEANA